MYGMEASSHLMQNDLFIQRHTFNAHKFQIITKAQTKCTQSKPTPQLLIDTPETNKNWLNYFLTTQKKNE